MKVEAAPLVCWYQRPPLLRYKLLLDNYSQAWKDLKPDARLGHLRYLWRNK